MDFKQLFGKRRTPAQEADLLAFGNELFAHTRPTPRPYLTSRIRKIALTGPSAQVPAARPVWGTLRTLRTPLAFASVLLVLAGGTSSAAANSLPGDPAFTIKRGFEEVQLIFASSEADRLQLLSDQEVRRAQEVETLARTDPPRAAEALLELTRTVAALNTALEGRTLSASTGTNVFVQTGSSITVLTQLAPQLPASAQAGIAHALSAQQQLAQKVRDPRDPKAAEVLPVPTPTATGRASAQPERPTPAAKKSSAPSEATTHDLVTPPALSDAKAVDQDDTAAGTSVNDKEERTSRPDASPAVKTNKPTPSPSPVTASEGEAARPDSNHEEEGSSSVPSAPPTRTPAVRTTTPASTAAPTPPASGAHRPSPTPSPSPRSTR